MFDGFVPIFRIEEKTMLMSKKIIIFLIFIFFLITISCKSSVQESYTTGISINISKIEEAEPNLDIIINNVQPKIKKHLPDAYFGRLGFIGKCQDLPYLRGKVDLLYKQVKPTLWGQEVIFARSVVTTSNQVMDLRIYDVSSPYILTKGLPVVTHKQFKEIAGLAYKYITTSGISDCDVIATQGNRVWNFRCLSTHEPKQPCNFGVDIQTKEITRPVLDEW